jgi:hypothetical protein
MAAERKLMSAARALQAAEALPESDPDRLGEIAYASMVLQRTALVWHDAVLEFHINRLPESVTLPEYTL